MTDSGEVPPGNTASGNAYVGVQASVVHGDIHFYQVLPGDPPERVYEIGVRYLDNGVPDRARELIDEAWQRGHSGNEVVFHWLLALLSGKKVMQLSEKDHTQLQTRLRRPLVGLGKDSWADGVDFVRCLLDPERSPDAEQLTRFSLLGPVQLGKIRQHLEFLAKGQMEQKLWDDSVAEARRRQLAENREHRVWKFFQPDPMRPRPRLVEPITIDLWTWLALYSAAVIFAGATLFLGKLAIQGEFLLGSAAWALAIAGTFVALVNGAYWQVSRHNVRQRRWLLLSDPPKVSTASPRGFAGGVDRLFDYYSAKYVPHRAERQDWLTRTGGIRWEIRNEIERTYRETRTTPDKVAWLIRHRIRELGRQWETGELWRYRELLATPVATRVATVIGVSAATTGTLYGSLASFRVDPVATLLALILVAGSARLGVPSWLRVVEEHDRFDRERQEAARIQARSEQAFEAWVARLADRPTESEMATWLDCDRRILMQNIFDHYHLAPGDLIAHAYIDAPGEGSGRARAVAGPWRYQHYTLITFLITDEGVRQVQSHLDFASGAFSGERRANYRFDAVATVHVDGAGSDARTFELGLLDGQPITIPLLDGSPDTEESERAPEEDPLIVSRVTFDAAGVKNAMHVLEGIAAEGKLWVTLEKRRSKDRMAGLSAALQESSDEVGSSGEVSVRRGETSRVPMPSWD